MPGRITELSESQIVADLLRDRRRQAAATTSVQMPQPAKDTFTVAASPATTYTLSAIPYQGTGGSSLNFSLNGVELIEGVDYTCDYTTAIVTVAATLKGTPTPADVLTADYWTTGDLIALTGPVDAGLILADTFNRADSASTINPASDGGSWTVDTATWGISSNQGYVANGVGGNGNWIRRDAGTNAVDVSLDVFLPTANTRLVWMDLAGSGTRTPSSTWTGYEVVFDGTNATGIILSRMGPGVTLQLGISHPADFRNTTATIRFTHDGSGNFVVYLNGAQQFTAVNSGGAVLTGTLVQLGTSELTGAGSIRFDNFSAS